MLNRLLDDAASTSEIVTQQGILKEYHEWWIGTDFKEGVRGLVEDVIQIFAYRESEKPESCQDRTVTKPRSEASTPGM